MTAIGKAVRKTTDDVTAEFTRFSGAGVLIRAHVNTDTTGTVTIQDGDTTLYLWAAGVTADSPVVEIGARFSTQCDITYSVTTDDITWVYSCPGSE